MSFINIQPRPESDIYFHSLIVEEESGKMIISIRKVKGFSTNEKPEKTFLRRVFEEVPAETYRYIKYDDDHGPPPCSPWDALVVFINKSINEVARKSRRGRGNHVIGSKKSLEKLRKGQFFEMSHLSNFQIIESEFVDDNKLVVVYKGPGEIDGPFYTNKDEDKIAFHEKWKNYVGVIELEEEK